MGESVLRGKREKGGASVRAHARLKDLKVVSDLGFGFFYLCSNFFLSFTVSEILLCFLYFFCLFFMIVMLLLCFHF